MSKLGACFKIRRRACFRAKGRMARRDEGAYPQRSVTEEQRSQTAFCPKTLRAAGLSPVAGVGSFLTASLRGCSELAALATAKIPRRRPPANFKTGSNSLQWARPPPAPPRNRGDRGGLILPLITANLRPPAPGTAATEAISGD